MTSTHETTLTKDFQDLEKEALKEISLEIIRGDLLKSLTDQHAKLRADLEQSCRKEIEKSLEEQLQKQFQSVIASCQVNMSEALSPLIKRTKVDINELNKTICQTHDLCHTIQKKYSVRWKYPFFSFILATSISGSLFGLIIFFLQVPFVSVLLMNDHTRASYEKGALLMAYEQKREARKTSQ